MRDIASLSLATFFVKPNTELATMQMEKNGFISKEGRPHENLLSAIAATRRHMHMYEIARVEPTEIFHISHKGYGQLLELPALSSCRNEFY